MHKIFVAVLFTVSLASAVIAQDPVKVDAKHYTLLSDGLVSVDEKVTERDAQKLIDLPTCCVYHTGRSETSIL
jgi:hypothetical protein